jgi:hypothetical protein
MPRIGCLLGIASSIRRASLRRQKECDMPSLPELVLIDLFNTIVERIKQTQPARTDGKPLSGGLVYSQLVLGMPIDPRDYANAWTPMGAATGGGQQQQAGVPAVKGEPDPKLLRSLEAAFKTSQLCNIMLQVTDDGSYLQYPIGRHLEFQYSGIVSAMTPLAVPPLPPDVQQAINDAMNVLYTMDTTDPANPVIDEPSPLYKKYKKNAMAYAKAKADYASAMAKALADPTQANIWPQLSAPYKQAVDDAWDTWKTEGAEKVERALAVYESQGINMQQAQIAKAKKQLDIWSLGLAGVPTDIPYSYVDPSEWCDPTADDIGFEQLAVKRTSEDHAAVAVTDATHSMYWNNEQKATSQSAGVGFLGIGSASEGSSNADQHAANGDASAYVFHQNLSNQFSDLEVNLEWGLVTIYRPWLNSDLFYMNNWYVPNERANIISDGQIKTQLGLTNKLLPLIPQQMLVVRNVSIKSSNWGDNAAILNQFYGGDQGSTDASQSSVGGSVGVAFGPISFGGGAQHSDNKAQGQGSGYSAGSALSNREANFDGTTLSINGAQVIAFLSDIVPPSPSIDDPNLPKPKAASTSGVSTPAGASSPQPPPSATVPG